MSFSKNVEFISRINTAMIDIMKDGKIDRNDIPTIVLLITNAGTAYYPNAFSIDGTSVTPKYVGGTAITAGNANSIDSYTMTIIKTASATYTVLLSQTKLA